MIATNTIKATLENLSLNEHTLRIIDREFIAFKVVTKEEISLLLDKFQGRIIKKDGLSYVVFYIPVKLLANAEIITPTHRDNVRDFIDILIWKNEVELFSNFEIKQKLVQVKNKDTKTLRNYISVSFDTLLNLR